MTDTTEILLIEDHPIVREACRSLLARRPDLASLEASSARDGLALNREALPSLILLDLELPDAKGLDIIGALRADNPGARVVVFSMHHSATCVTTALRNGALGYVTKSDDPATILAAIDRVRDGSAYLGPSAAQSVALAGVEAATDPLAGLSAREREVMALLGEGRSLGEISALLEIGYKTAANIVSALKQKLRVATSAALIKLAVECSLRG
jgi:two-component system invasion response regulator UvrY